VHKKITSLRLSKRAEDGLNTLREVWGASLTETLSILIEKEIATMNAATVWQIREDWGPNVADIAAIAGATGIREIGDGGEGEAHCTFFELLGDGAKFPIRGATTNADPVWEDEDAAAYADLAEACGVQL
jgi:hypothetical protein